MRSTMMDVPLSLNHLLERAGQLFAGNEIVSRLPDKSLRRHSYGEFHRRTRALASALQKLGLKKGDRVATLCWNHHAHLECYFGIPAAGGVMHTLNLRLAPDEIGWIAGNAEDRFLIVDDVLLPLYRQFADLHALREGDRLSRSPARRCRTSFVDYEALLADADPDGFRYADARRERPGRRCATPPAPPAGPRAWSIRTAPPSCTRWWPACGDFWGLRGTDVVLPVTPMFHANSWGMPYGAVMMGVKLVFPGPHLHPDDLLDLMQVEPPTLSLGVPTIWMSLIQTYRRVADRAARPLEAAARHALAGRRRGSARSADPRLRPARDLDRTGLGHDRDLAGAHHLLSARRTAGRRRGRALPARRHGRRAGAAGGPAGAHRRRRRAALGRQDVGEIQVRGPFITGSYHEVPVSADKFTADGWLRTGDVATIDELGFVRITDRTKDLIKSGGEWISSVDLENALMAHPAVAEAAVIAIPDEKWSERPLACVVLKTGSDGAAG